MSKCWILAQSPKELSKVCSVDVVSLAGAVTEEALLAVAATALAGVTPFAHSATLRAEIPFTMAFRTAGHRFLRRSKSDSPLPRARTTLGPGGDSTLVDGVRRGLDPGLARRTR